jgi:hypothetical protein
MKASFIANMRTGLNNRVPALVAFLIRDEWAATSASREEALRLLRAYWGSFAED